MTCLRRGAQLKYLDWLRDHGHGPDEQPSTLGPQDVRAAKVHDDLYLFYRSLTSDELERQGKGDALRGVVALALLRSDEPLAWELAQHRSEQQRE